ncbi:putative 2-aminoethylphosphonate ABC transporter permease subunit [Ramlibacter albus]|uniref:2-aminoethylphosphonate ABC transporter permease subunit n=1 Tax=Ramlibacter albus TaxID=2079448 RepID=A0A923MEL7_9BURK|nr:putative 2-aminoethylphosphonate ABC transporter permease subunit [Ramlibacter albus]MBC5768161.1 putative 2-aminoethylphosphonate ABC transporter permease subunit [Ramlibacter albus]
MSAVAGTYEAPVERRHLELAKEDWIARAVLLAVCGFLVLFLLAPMAAILVRAVQDDNGHFIGLAHFMDYLSTPALLQAMWNSVWVSAVVVLISVPLAFVFAYALHRSCAPFKGTFRLVALIPLLAPSLLSAIAFIQWFGNQGVAKPLLTALGVETIYGPLGIILAEVYNTFPHALMILLTALSLADGRLYEAADSLGTSKLRKFFTITLPSCKYGLVSAATVVFTYVVSDFGAPKVIGGNFNVLSVDVFKQVVGQQHFGRGAVVGIILLIPSIVSFCIDSRVRRKLRAQLSARSVPFAPRPHRVFDALMTAYCALVCAALLAVVGMAMWTSLIKFWPYDLSLTLRHYEFALVGSDLASAYGNSLKLAFTVAFAGTAVVFIGAYLAEKTRGLDIARPLFHLLAMLSMAVPGLVLGLGYIMFFNHPGNPMNGLYGGFAILALSVIVHYYTSSHLTAVTALKQIDNEFEAVSASLQVPFYVTFWRVTLPVCLPALLDVARYYFVVSMATLSGVVFLYSPDTVLASVAIMNLDEAGEIGPAAALASLTVLTSVAVCLVYALATRVLLRKTQAWRYGRG